METGTSWGLVDGREMMDGTSETEDNSIRAN